MAVDRKVVSFTVDTKNLSSAPNAYEDALQLAWDTAVSGVGSGNYMTTHVEKCLGTTSRDRFIVWVEKAT